MQRHQVPEVREAEPSEHCGTFSVQSVKYRGFIIKVFICQANYGFQVQIEIISLASSTDKEPPIYLIRTLNAFMKL